MRNTLNRGLSLIQKENNPLLNNALYADVVLKCIQLSTLIDGLVNCYGLHITNNYVSSMPQR